MPSETAARGLFGFAKLPLSIEHLQSHLGWVIPVHSGRVSVLQEDDIYYKSEYDEE